MSAGTGGHGLNKAKGRQQRRLKTYYSMQEVRTTINKKRNLRNQIRSNPADIAAIDRYEKEFGRADTLGVNSKGRRVSSRVARKAV